MNQSSELQSEWNSWNSTPTPSFSSISWTNSWKTAPNAQTKAPMKKSLGESEFGHYPKTQQQALAFLTQKESKLPIATPIEYLPLKSPGMTTDPWFVNHNNSNVDFRVQQPINPPVISHHGVQSPYYPPVSVSQVPQQKPLIQTPPSPSPLQHGFVSPKIPSAIGTPKLTPPPAVNNPQSFDVAPSTSRKSAEVTRTSPPVEPSSEASSETSSTGNIEEEISSQNLYKTELCRSWKETGECRYGHKCQFAHGEHEMRLLMRHPKYKTESCKTYASNGACPYGERCRFLHPEDSSMSRSQFSKVNWSDSWNSQSAPTSPQPSHKVVAPVPASVAPSSTSSPLSSSERSRLSIFQSLTEDEY